MKLTAILAVAIGLAAGAAQAGEDRRCYVSHNSDVLFDAECYVTTDDNGSIRLSHCDLRDSDCEDEGIANVDTKGDGSGIARFADWMQINTQEPVRRVGRCWLDYYISGAVRVAICTGIPAGAVPELLGEIGPGNLHPDSP